jgi:putative membrane protein
MTPQEEHETDKASARQPPTSGRVTDHLANERTFLAWIRTGLALSTFGFVIERFGLALEQVGVKNSRATTGYHYSTVFGISLTVLGVVVLIVSLLQFLHNRLNIDTEQYRPSVTFPIVLTVLSCVVGVLLAIYLVLTG